MSGEGGPGSVARLGRVLQRLAERSLPTSGSELGTITQVSPTITVRLDTGQEVPQVSGPAGLVVGQRVVCHYIASGHDLVVAAITAAEPVPVRFTIGGEVATTELTDCPLVDFPIDVNLARVRGRLSGAGSSTTTVDVYKNGSSIATVSFGSGDTLATVTIGEPFDADDDTLAVACTAAGSGATGLSLRFDFEGA